MAMVYDDDGGGGGGGAAVADGDNGGDYDAAEDEGNYDDGDDDGVDNDDEDDDGNDDDHDKWWRHQMQTFAALLALCAGNSPVSGDFHSQRPVTRSFDAFFDLRLNKRLSKQSWGWWFDMPSSSLWRHCNGMIDDVSRRGPCWKRNKYSSKTSVSPMRDTTNFH